jgi:5-methyltetrahydropteroyltriglutamate--homocysteine methyltransferase
MKVLVANHSSYPRIGPQPHEQRLRRAISARERGEIDEAALLVVEHGVITEIVAEQVEAGLDLVTDGQVRWYDPVSHLLAHLPGVRINGLLRFFDTNFYFRQPVVASRVARAASGLAADFRHAQDSSPVPVKPVLTGPYTLARLSKIEPAAYAHYRDLAEDLSVIVAHEVRELAAAGATVIQLDEPAVCPHPDDIRLLRRLFEPIYDARGAAQIAIATYFFDSDPLYPQLNSVPADIVALDLTTSTSLRETLAATGASKTLALGVVDARSTRLEDADAVARQLDHLLQRYVLDTVYLQPSCGLEYLPREKAREKLRRLATIRDLLQGSGVR